jgi:uncharacterized membrane protein
MMWNMAQFSWFWPVCAVLALVLISTGIVLFSRWFSNTVNHDAGAQRRQAALDIARERYARGEITQAEFSVLRRGLRP